MFRLEKNNSLAITNPDRKLNLLDVECYHFEQIKE